MIWIYIFYLTVLLQIISSVCIACHNILCVMIRTPKLTDSVTDDNRSWELDIADNNTAGSSCIACCWVLDIADNNTAGSSCIACCWVLDIADNNTVGSSCNACCWVLDIADNNTGGSSCIAYCWVLDIAGNNTAFTLSCNNSRVSSVFTDDSCLF